MTIRYTLTSLFALISLLGFSQTEVVSNTVSAPQTLEITKDMFSTTSAKAKEEGAVVSWTLDYDHIEALREKEVIIRYISSIGSKRIKKGLEAEYTYTDPIPATDIKYELKGLVGNEKYVFNVGLPKTGNVPSVTTGSENVVWSDKIKVKTKRGWGLLKFLILIGSLGLFIFGMKTMSDGLQRASSDKLRSMLGSITANRVKGVITGFFSTAIVQSSSVTTVMTVSLVNAGLLNLRQSAGVMMGANIR